MDLTPWIPAILALVGGLVGGGGVGALLVKWGIQRDRHGASERTELLKALRDELAEQREEQRGQANRIDSLETERGGLLATIGELVGKGADMAAELKLVTGERDAERREVGHMRTEIDDERAAREALGAALAAERAARDQDRQKHGLAIAILNRKVEQLQTYLAAVTEERDRLAAKSAGQAGAGG